MAPHSKHMRIIVFSTSVLGIVTGVICGLSSSPVAALIAQALVAGPGLAVGFISARKSPTNTDSLQAMAALSSTYAVFAATLLVGLAMGMFIRAKEPLEPGERAMLACNSDWSLEFCTHMMIQDVLLDQMGATEASLEAWRASVQKCGQATSEDRDHGAAEKKQFVIRRAANG